MSTAAILNTGDLVAYNDAPYVPGKVVEILDDGRVIVQFPNGTADVSAADLIVLDRGPSIWAAFRAGFQASGEGWNGEYPEEFPEDDVRRAFDAWRAEA